MILRWKTMNMDEFRAALDGMDYRLVRENEAWRLWLYAAAPGAALAVNGKEAALVRGRWARPKAAMDAVEAALNRVLRNKIAVATARQRGMSPAAAVAHA